MIRIYLILLASTLIFLSCSQESKEVIQPNLEKEAILASIQNETKAAFARDYKTWKTYWIQDSTISKTYINYPENSFSEMIGWKHIDDFVRNYIEAHPEPAPLPALPDKVDIRLYKNGAWVSYQIKDELFGWKRETRLMEKQNNQWKIAGLHTTIYGFDKEE